MDNELFGETQRVQYPFIIKFWNVVFAELIINVQLLLTRAVE